MTQLAVACGSDVLDLLEGGDGYTLRLDGWVPQVARDEGDGYSAVDEVITIRADFDTQAELAESIRNDIEARVEYIRRRLGNPVASYPAWLRWGLPGESSTRQALIARMSYTFGRSPFFPPTTRGTSGKGQMPDLTLAFTRFPFWELTESVGVAIDNLIAGGCNVSATDSSSDVLGTVPGRIGQLRITGGSDLTEFWLGFRTDLHGGRSYFQPVWDFNTVSVTGGADTTESGGTVTWTPGSTTTLSERFTISMSQVSGITSDRRDCQRGTFLVLMRANVSSGGTRTFDVRLSDGFTGSSNWNTHSRVEVSGTTTLFYPLGTVTIPPLGIRDRALARTLLGAYTLRIEAGVNTSGTGNLEMTRFVLIPQDEGFLHIKGVHTSALYMLYISTEADGVLAAATHTATSGAVITPTELDAVDFTLPANSANAILAGHSSSGGQNLTAEIDVWIDHYPRWLGLSGAASTGGGGPLPVGS